MSKAKPWVRTCMKCGKNCYSPGEFRTHAAEAHGKSVPNSVISEPRVVSNRLHANIPPNVPEEALVKPKKVEKKPDTVAESRPGKKAKEEKAEKPAKKEAPKTRGRRGRPKSKKKED